MRNLLYALAGLAAFVMLGCGRPQPTAAASKEEHGHAEEAHGGEHSADLALTEEAIKTAGIETQVAQSMPLQAQLRVSGVVSNTGQGRAVVTPPVGGKILSLLANVGDTVTTGQALATIESVDLAQAAAAITDAERARGAAESDVKRAKAELDLAKARLRTAQAALGRQQAFARTGAFSQPGLQDAQRELNDAESELESAQKEEVVHRAQLERAERLFRQELISRTELENARLDVEQDRIRQEKAKRQIALARQAYEREKEIATKGLHNAREIQAAEAEARAANLEVGRARVALQGADAAVQGARRAVANAQSAYAAVAGSGNRAGGSRVTLVAPIGGTIAHREATLGQAVERTTEVFEIDNLRSVWITASVPEKEIAHVRRGGPVRVSTSAYPNRTFVGVVQVVSSRLDAKTRTMPVQCLVQNVSGLLKSGMFAQVELGIGASSAGIAVPRSAIVSDGDERVLFVAEGGGKFERRTVRIGREQREMLEILDGLKAGERVVTKGAFVLKSQAQKDELKGHED